MSTKIAVKPQKVSVGHRFFDRNDMQARAQSIEDMLRERVKQHAVEQELDLGQIKVHWEVHVEAPGWKMPDEMLLPYGLDDTHPNSESVTQQIREAWLGALERADAEGWQPIRVDVPETAWKADPGEVISYLISQWTPGMPHGRKEIEEAVDRVMVSGPTRDSVVTDLVYYYSSGRKVRRG